MNQSWKDFSFKKKKKSLKPIFCYTKHIHTNKLDKSNRQDLSKLQTHIIYAPSLKKKKNLTTKRWDGVTGAGHPWWDTGHFQALRLDAGRHLWFLFLWPLEAVDQPKVSRSLLSTVFPLNRSSQKRWWMLELEPFWKLSRPIPSFVNKARELQKGALPRPRSHSKSKLESGTRSQSSWLPATGLPVHPS